MTNWSAYIQQLKWTIYEPICTNLSKFRRQGLFLSQPSADTVKATWQLILILNSIRAAFVDYPCDMSISYPISELMDIIFHPFKPEKLKKEVYFDFWVH